MKRPLTPAEAGALEKAAAEFLFWNTETTGHTRKPVNPKLLAEVRAAAGAMRKALQPLTEVDEQPTLIRLGVRMQEVDGFCRPSSDYRDELVGLVELSELIFRACGAEVAPSRKKDPRVTEWVWRAAEAWAQAGGTPSARHRFGSALMSFKVAGIPRVTSEVVVARALSVWKMNRKPDGG